MATVYLQCHAMCTNMILCSILLQETLDADDTPLVSQSGVRMSRDIVQFVPLRQFQNQSGANFSLVSTFMNYKINYSMHISHYHC